MPVLNYDPIHASWHPIFDKALAEVDPAYLQQLGANDIWLPGAEKIFNAFTLPLTQCRYILFGESPYPRKESANGYAFWDAAVHELWSKKGFSTAVNRATSLRNFIKMLLVADGALKEYETSQQHISQLDKSSYITSIDELFANLLHQGFLLLNASLVLNGDAVRNNARAWCPFMNKLLEQLYENNPKIVLVLLGKIAQEINHMPYALCFKQEIAEHPYNISFIHNKEMQRFFGSMQLLRNTCSSLKNTLKSD